MPPPSLLLALLLAQTRPVAPLHLASCSGQAAEYRATLRYHVLLDQAFLDPAAPEDAQVRTAIKQQLRYIWGWYRTHTDLPNAPELVLGAEEPEIELVHRKVSTYGSDLTLDWTETAPELQITDPYTLTGIHRGFTHRSDPALVVDYVAHFQVALCGASRKGHSTLPAAVPSDPWLMHWRVPRSAYRPLRYFDETAVTNPCVDNDYADLPHPYYHWYDWLPERHGPDDHGEPFDCRKLLHIGVDYFPVTVELDQLTSPSSAFDDLRAHLAGGSTGTAPLNVTILFGVLDPAFVGVPREELQAALGEGTAAELAPLLSARESKIERGTRHFVRLLADLPQIMTIERFQSKVEDEFLEAELTGHLLRSGRAIALHGYVGRTNVFGPAPHHWEILHHALAASDVIIYAGHSGIGENFRLTQIASHLKLEDAAFKRELQQAPFQLIAFLSCYSYMYFGRDLEDATAQGGQSRKFIYSGTPFTKQSEGSLAVLDLIDQVLAPTAGTAPSLRFIKPDDFLMVKGSAPHR